MNIQVKMESQLQLSELIIKTIVEDKNWNYVGITEDGAIEVTNYDDTLSIFFSIKGTYSDETHKFFWEVDHSYVTGDVYGKEFRDKDIEKLMVYVADVEYQLTHILQLKTDPTIK